jgi:regulator of replication initiation timing
MDTPFVSINSDRGAASLAVSLTASQAERMADSVLFLDREERDRRERRHQKRWTAAVASVSVASMVVALAAMIVETSVFAYAAFLIPFLTGPCVIHQRRKLHRLPRLTAVVNDCRQEINDVMVLNGRLRAENARLKGQVARLAEAEAKLGQVAAQSNTNVDRVRELVRENGETQRQMKVREKGRKEKCVFFISVHSLTLSLLSHCYTIYTETAKCA